MRRRCVATVFVVTAMVSLAVPAAGQRAHEWTVPRTLDGQPDLQGAWSFATITPLERPREFAERQLLTSEEVAVLDEDAATRASSERRGSLTVQRDLDLAYDQFWWDRGTSDGRTSLIVDPTQTVGYRSRPKGGRDVTPAELCETVLPSVRKTAALGSGAFITRKRVRQCQLAVTTIISGSCRRPATS